MEGEAKVFSREIADFSREVLEYVCNRVVVYSDRVDFRFRDVYF